MNAESEFSSNIENSERIGAGSVRKLEHLIPALLFLGALGMFSLQWFHGPAFTHILNDVTVITAERVQAGDIPYRDFWTIYAPGSYYLLALLFDTFGNHILVSVVASSILSAAAVCLCYRLVRKMIGGTLPALACAVVFSAAIYSTGYYLNLGPYPPAIACILTALNFVADFHKTGSTRSLFAAGLATGLAIIFKHDVGGYAAIAITAGLIAGHYGKDTISSHLRTATAKSAIFAAGAAILSIPVAIYFAVLAGPDMWRDLVVFPLTDFRFSRPENYPGLLPTGIFDGTWFNAAYKFVFYLRLNLPFFVVVTAVITLVITRLKGNRDQIPMALTFVVLYLLHYASAHVQINTNVMSLPLYAGMLGAISYRIVDSRIRETLKLRLRLIALAVAVAAFTAYILQPVYLMIKDDKAYLTASLPKIAGIRVSPENNETFTKLVAFVNENIPPDKRIFIGLHRHDTTVIGDGSTYFILDRLNATRQDQLHPGIVDTARIQREMIRDLQSRDVTYIFIKRDVFSDETLDRLRKMWSVTLPESGSTELDDYIHANYRKVRTIGSYEILRKSKPDVNAPGK